jgi:hypothetical protein
VELAVNTHVRHSTIFSCELDVATRFAVSAGPRRYSSNGKHDILLGQNSQNRKPDFGALRLGNTNVIRIGADRLGHFFRLGKSVGESLSPVVGNEIPWVFGDWIRSAIALLAATLFHLSGILILPYTGGWSFLFTGAVMVFSLLVLAELQWDMRHPINYDALTPQ